MSIRKIAGLAAGFALAVGLIGNGVSAQWSSQVTAQENINVGRFGCAIVDWTGGSNPTGQQSVIFTAPPINISAPGTAPFSFTVKNTGTVAQVVTVSSLIAGLPAPFSDSLGAQSPVFLAGNATRVYYGGLSWTDLSNYPGGYTGNIKYTVNCNETNQTAIFDNTPATASAFYSPKLYYSESLGALSETQFGTQVGFSGSARKLQTVTVAMSDWACQSGAWNSPSCLTTPGATFPVPITFNVYNVGTNGAVGSLLGTATQTFAIPYRPSADSTCPATGSQTPSGSAFKDPAGDCQNGLVSEITFTFTGVTLPNNVIFGIAYAPTGDAGSLNVMLYPSDLDTPLVAQPAVGSFPLPSNTYTDRGSSFHLDTDLSHYDYSGIQPAVQFTASN